MKKHKSLCARYVPHDMTLICNLYNKLLFKKILLRCFFNIFLTIISDFYCMELHSSSKVHIIRNYILSVYINTTYKGPCYTFFFIYSVLEMYLSRRRFVVLNLTCVIIKESKLNRFSCNLFKDNGI